MRCSMTEQKRGRPPTPCPRCGSGTRCYQVLVQSRPVGVPMGTAKYQQKGGSSSITVCASCAGQLRAELTLLIERAGRPCQKCEQPMLSCQCPSFS